MLNKLAMLRLVRWINQLFILITQSLLWYCIIIPLYKAIGYQPSLAHYEFFLLVGSTMLIAAGGYIINDYFDVDADMVNKPIKVTVGRYISRNMALALYFACNIIGVALSFYLGWKSGNYKLGYIHIAAAALLWFYSTNLKKRFFIGNLLVAFMAALVVFLPALYEANLASLISFKAKEFIRIWFEYITGYGVEVQHNPNLLNNDITNLIIRHIWGYAIFAFLLTLVREIVKDVEDIEGDENEGYKTVPIVLGVNGAKLLAAVFIIITVYFIAKFQFNQLVNFVQGYREGFAKWYELFPFVYALICIQIPLLYVFFKLKSRNTLKIDHTFLSVLLKFIMLAGILYMVYFRFSIRIIDAAETGMPTIEINESPEETELPADTMQLNPILNIEE